MKSTPLLPKGTVIRKKSGKPFKNGEKIDKIAGYTWSHPYREGIPAYWLEESQCWVEAWRCEKDDPREVEDAIVALEIDKVLVKKKRELVGMRGYIRVECKRAVRSIWCVYVYDTKTKFGGAASRERSIVRAYDLAAKQLIQTSAEEVLKRTQQYMALRDALGFTSLDLGV